MGEWEKANFKFLCNCSCSSIWFAISNNLQQSDFPPKGIWFHLFLHGTPCRTGDHGRAQAHGPEGWSDAASLCWPFAIGVHENVDMLPRAEPSWLKPQQNRQFVQSVPVTSFQMFRVALAVVETIVVRERQPPPPVWAASPSSCSEQPRLWHLLLLPWKLLSCHTLSSAALLPG